MAHCKLNKTWLLVSNTYFKSKFSEKKYETNNLIILPSLIPKKDKGNQYTLVFCSIGQ